MQCLEMILNKKLYLLKKILKYYVYYMNSNNIKFRANHLKLRVKKGIF